MINRVRSRLYWWARLLGDINSILRGPIPFVKRLIRKKLYKWVGPVINKL